MDKPNLAQELADDLLTDPDKDAEGRRAPLPPQTVEAEPTSARPGQHAVADEDDDE